jgi:hypothetical protein
VTVTAALALTLVVTLAFILALDGTATLALALVHGLAALFAFCSGAGAFRRGAISGGDSSVRRRGFCGFG